MIEISGLNQFYGGSHILWDIDMSVPTGFLHRADGPQTAWARPRCCAA